MQPCAAIAVSITTFVIRADKPVAGAIVDGERTSQIADSAHVERGQVKMHGPAALMELDLPIAGRCLTLGAFEMGAARKRRQPYWVLRVQFLCSRKMRPTVESAHAGTGVFRQLKIDIGPSMPRIDMHGANDPAWLACRNSVPRIVKFCTTRPARLTISKRAAGAGASVEFRPNMPESKCSCP